MGIFTYYLDLKDVVREKLEDKKAYLKSNKVMKVVENTFKLFYYLFRSV